MTIKSSDKVFVVTPSTAEAETSDSPLSKRNQTEFPFVTDEKSYVLESSVCEITEKQNDAPKPVLVYFTDTKRFYTDISDENVHIDRQNSPETCPYHENKSENIFARDASTNTENNVVCKDICYQKHDSNASQTEKAIKSEIVKNNTHSLNNERREHIEHQNLLRDFTTLREEHKKLLGIKLSFI